MKISFFQTASIKSTLDSSEIIEVLENNITICCTYLIIFKLCHVKDTILRLLKRPVIRF